MAYLFIGMIIGGIIGLTVGSLAVAFRLAEKEITRGGLFFYTNGNLAAKLAKFPFISVYFTRVNLSFYSLSYPY